MKRRAKRVDKELQDEMVGMLTAISIVSKRLAGRLLKHDKSDPIPKDTLTLDKRRNSNESHSDSNVNKNNNK